MIRPVLAAAILAAVIIGGVAIGVLRTLTDTMPDWRGISSWRWRSIGVRWGFCPSSPGMS